MRNLKRITSLLLTILLIVSIMPASLVAFASADFVDFPTGWSAEAMQAAVDNGLVKGKGENRIEPKALLTRAEAVTIINRAFGATVKADISSFTDVTKDDWYYDEFAKAVNMNTIVGDGNSLIRPDDSITRQEIFTVIARALVLSESDKSVLDGFSDADGVADWALPYICAMVKNGYINGNPSGFVNAQDYITREEFAQMMHNIFKTYISEPGTVTAVGADCVMIRTGGVTLKNVTIEKDLVLGDGVGAGNIVLENVDIKGRLLCRGGEGTVKLVNTTVGENVVVCDVNGTVNFLNYETEKPFENRNLITPATFLKADENKHVGIGNGGGGGSSSKWITVVFNGEEFKYTKGKKISEETELLSKMNAYTPAAGYSVEFNTNADGTGDTVTGDYTIVQSITVYPVVKLIVYNIIYEENGGDSIYDGTYTVEDEVILPVAEREGYIFKGWHKLEDLSDEPITKIERGTIGNITLYAKWEKKEADKILVTFDGIGYQYTPGKKISEETDLLEKMNAYKPSKGYTLESFNTKEDGNGDKVTGDYVVTEAITVYPIEKAIEYKIIYNTNGGETIANGKYTIKDEVTLPVPVRSGYDFKGWYDNDGNLVEKISVGTTGDITLTAKWEPKSPPVIENERLYFEATVSGNDITVNVKLSDIPKDINDLSAITLKYTYDTDKLSYLPELPESTSTELGGSLAATAGNISWYTTTPVTSDVLTANGNILFTVKFKKKPAAEGEAIFTFGDVEIADSAYTQSSKYTKQSGQVTLVAGSETTFYTVKLYKGTAIEDNLKGKIENVAANTKITDSQINGVLGENWADTNKVTTYTDSYGNAHCVKPSLWYKDGTEWKVFDTDMPITSDLDICMLSRIIQIELTSTAVIKGHSIPSIWVTIPYDDETPIQDSAITGMIKLGNKLDAYLNQLEAEGVDVYASAMEKLSAKGLTDSEGNVLLQTINLKLSDIVSESQIEDKINGTLRKSLTNEDIVAAILENDAIVDQIVNDEKIISAIMNDGTLYGNLITKDSFKKTLAGKYGEFPDLKDEVDAEVGGDATTFINEYVSGTLGEPYYSEVDDAIEEYARKIPAAYRDGTLSAAVKTFINNQIKDFGRATIADFINDAGTSRDDFMPIINDNAQIIIDNCNATPIYAELLNCFKTGTDITVNKDNYTLVRALANALDLYTGAQIKAEFADEKADIFVKLIGEETFNRYLEKGIDSFVDVANGVCDDMEADVAIDPESANTYPCTSVFSVDADIIGDILYYNYERGINKLKNKLMATPEIKYSENTKLQAVIDIDPFDIIFDKVPAEGLKSGYKIKSDIMGVYNDILNDVILAHDALVWYNQLPEAEIAAAEDAASTILARYANKFNEIMMNYINNGALPGGMTLDQLLGYSARIESLYYEYEDKINKALDIYAEYFDRDYTEVLNKVMNTIIPDVAIEKQILNVDDVFDIVLEDGKFAEYPKIEKLINKFKDCKYTPAPDEYSYYVDAYTNTKTSINLFGKDFGDVTVDITRFLQ